MSNANTQHTDPNADTVCSRNGVRVAVMIVDDVIAAASGVLHALGDFCFDADTLRTFTDTDSVIAAVNNQR